MKQLAAAACTLVLVMSNAGCALVMTSAPLRADPTALDQERLTGIWQLEDGTIHVHFTADGVGHLASLEWEDDHFALLTGEVLVSHGAAGSYLSIQGQERSDEQPEDGFLLARYDFTADGDLQIWLARPAAFEQAIAEHGLQGTVERSGHSTSVLVTSPPAELLAFLDDPAHGQLFEQSQPLALRRIAGGDGGTSRTGGS